MRMLATLYIDDMTAAKATLLKRGEAIAAARVNGTKAALKLRQSDESDFQFRSHRWVQRSDIILGPELRDLVVYAIDKVKQVEELMEMLVSKAPEEEPARLSFEAGLTALVDKVEALMTRMAALEATPSSVIADLRDEIVRKDAEIADRNELYHGLIVMLDALTRDKFTEEQFERLGRMVVEHSIVMKLAAFEARLAEFERREAREKPALPLPQPPQKGIPRHGAPEV
jgi:hypothetical protein